MNEEMNFEKIDYLIRYVELLVKLQHGGLKLHHEINMALKQLERDMKLDDSSYVIVQNGELQVKNCVFIPKENGEEPVVKVNNGKLLFQGVSVIKESKSKPVSKNIVSDDNSSDKEFIDKLIALGMKKDGTLDEEVLTLLKSKGVIVEFKTGGIRWYRK